MGKKVLNEKESEASVLAVQLICVKLIVGELNLIPECEVAFLKCSTLWSIDFCQGLMWSRLYD